MAGFFVALAALFSPLARTMFRWVEQGSAELATIPPERAARDLAFALAIQWAQQKNSGRSTTRGPCLFAGR